jgi:hypothetical protein
VSNTANHDCFPPDAPPEIPPEAVEVHDPTASIEAGHRAFDCVIDGQVVGARVRDERGTLVREYALKDGVWHGIERWYDQDGALEFETSRCHGAEHGIAKQWDKGRLIGTYTMDHGTGLDLWRGSDGSLLEERYVKDSYRHGFERWWNGDDRSVWMESHFRVGVEHGIFRKWLRRPYLTRGYPQYFVNDKRVTKRQYLKAAAGDPTLPPFREEDNRPERQLPAEYVAAQRPS